jgi:nitrate reductase cytochrome c-type subunit
MRRAAGASLKQVRHTHGAKALRSLLCPALAVVLLCTGTDAIEEEDIAVPGRPGAVKSSPAVRAKRRTFDGAPPVIPHRTFGAACTSCHTQRGMAVEGIGFAPPSPHIETVGMSAISRCQQCHVFRQTSSVWRQNGFEGLRQDLRHGARTHPYAPPVIPHRTFMRENCLACHSGPAAREQIRTPHPERMRCRQCHVEQRTAAEFQPASMPAGRPPAATERSR